MIDPPLKKSTADSGHNPVLMDQVLQYLDVQPGMTVLDATLGRGGHAAAIIPKLGKLGRYIGLDVDPINLEFAKNRLKNLSVSPNDMPRLDLIHANFADLTSVLHDLHESDASSPPPPAVPTIHRLLADLGFASNQMDNPARGFSFAADGPLDMRLDPRLTTTAADLVNTLDQQELANLIYRYGEERRSRPIARKIVEKRQRSPIKTTSELARIVCAAFGPSQKPSRAGKKTGRKTGRKTGKKTSGNIHPATRTFMALRIAVNQELDALESLLKQLPAVMGKTSKPNNQSQPGIAVIISFHSLEDRIVKQTFNQWALGNPQNIQNIHSIHNIHSSRGQKLTRKVVTADENETFQNPRSRSAKLRAFQFDSIF